MQSSSLGCLHQGRALARAGRLLAPCLIACSAYAGNPPLDCDNNGVDDVLQWGPNYAYWDGNGVGNDGGSLNNWFEWCSTDFNGLNPLDRLVFGQTPGQSMDLCTMNSGLTAWSLRMVQGAFEITSDNATLTLNGPDLNNPSKIEVNGILSLDAPVVQTNASVIGAITIGHSGGAGILEVRGHSLTSPQTHMYVGTTGHGDLIIAGGTVTTWGTSVGVQGNSTSGIEGSVYVGPAGRLNSDLSIMDVVTVDGIVQSNVSVTGPGDLGERGILQGSGLLDSSIDGRGLIIAPRMGPGHDGVTDATLTISRLWLTTSWGSGVLRIAVEVDQATGAPIVPMAKTTISCNPGGLLQLGFSPDSVDKVIGFNPVLRMLAGASPGNFQSAQVNGLPSNKTVRVERRAGSEPGVVEIGFTVVGMTPPAAANTGPTNALLRVVTDTVMGDFNHDGVKDCAMAMARDSSGTSQVRFFEIGAGNALTLKASVDVLGDGQRLATLPSAQGDGVALSLGSADRIAVLHGDGNWGFNLSMIATGTGSLPRGIAVGRFVDPAATTTREIAVGCMENGQVSGQIKVYAPNGIGGYELARLISNCPADVLRTARFDDRSGDDLLAIDKAGKRAQIVTRVDLASPIVSSLSLPATPTGASTIELTGPTALHSAVISMEGSSSSPENPIESGVVVRVTQGVADAGTYFHFGDNPLSIACADFDGDGDGDIATACTVDGIEQVRLYYNRIDPVAPEVLLFQDLGRMPGGFQRPRIVAACNADAKGAPKLFSVNAGAGTGGSLGPEFDGGVGTFGGGGPPGDTNGDGAVDAQDLAAVLSAWGSGEPAADLNDDGIVNALDLAAVLSGWAP